MACFYICIPIFILSQWDKAETNFREVMHKFLDTEANVTAIQVHLWAMYNKHLFISNPGGGNVSLKP